MNVNNLLYALVALVQILVLGGLFLLARRFLRSKKPMGSAGTISVDTLGLATIPVFATFTGLRGLSPWLAVATNSLNPHLAISPDGLEYRVISKRVAPFSTVESVEVRRGPGTVNLCFVFTSGLFTLSANVGDAASAVRALSRLPPSILRGPSARKLQEL
ncbi:hypothetical protein C8J42_10851 [Sphingomonas sp. PP-CE-1A-559]|jgi:hypothetical protein|nr:hypothetical protein C8J42_10851 [Sphingomonas sp. PP-CE-1A-559]